VAITSESHLCTPGSKEQIIAVFCSDMVSMMHNFI
jgi:hypothetical protein